MDWRWMGGGWEVDGRWMGGGWEVDGRRMGGGWEVDGRRMGGGCGECVWVHYEQTVTTPLHKDAPRKSKNLPSRGIPGRFLSLVLISPNLA